MRAGRHHIPGIEGRRLPAALDRETGETTLARETCVETSPQNGQGYKKGQGSPNKGDPVKETCPEFPPYEGPKWARFWRQLIGKEVSEIRGGEE